MGTEAIEFGNGSRDDHRKISQYILAHSTRFGFVKPHHALKMTTPYEDLMEFDRFSDAQKIRLAPGHGSPPPIISLRMPGRAQTSA